MMFDSADRTAACVMARSSCDTILLTPQGCLNVGTLAMLVGVLRGAVSVSLVHAQRRQVSPTNSKSWTCQARCAEGMRTKQVRIACVSRTHLHIAGIKEHLVSLFTSLPLLVDV